MRLQRLNSGGKNTSTFLDLVEKAIGACSLLPGGMYLFRLSQKKP